MKTIRLAVRNRISITIFMLLVLLAGNTALYAQVKYLVAQETIPSQFRQVSLELTAQPEAIMPLDPEIPVVGRCTGEFNVTIGDQRAEFCAEYSIEVSDLHEALLIALEVTGRNRNIHFGLAPHRPISEGAEFYVLEGFGEPLDYLSELGLADRESILETGTWFIGVFYFEPLPIGYTLTASLTPIELISGGPWEGSIIDNTFGGRISPGGGVLGFVDYFIEVPSGAQALEIRLENSIPGNNIDLIARFGRPVDLTEGGRLLADYISDEPGGIEFISITADSDPPLRQGRYYIKIGNFEPQRQRFTLTATVILEEQPPVIQVDPERLYFTGEVGGPNPQPQTLQITNAGGGTLNWSATADVTWLSLTPSQGTAPSTVRVAVDITGLSAGRYQAQITITAPQATNSPLIVPVVLELTQPPALSVRPESLRFTAQVGGPNPEPQDLEVANAGGGILEWSARVDVPWLRVEPGRGTLAAGQTEIVRVSVDIIDLAAGTYEGRITVEAAGVGTVIVPVTLEVQEQPPPAGELLALKFIMIEFLRPEDWERRLQEGCVVYKNIGAEPSPIRVTLTNNTVLEFNIPVGNEVIICGDVVHIDTREEAGT